MAFWKGGRTLHHHGPMTRDEFKKLPRHVAIIMDGNGRWAKKHKLAVAKGHRQRRGDPAGDHSSHGRPED